MNWYFDIIYDSTRLRDYLSLFCLIALSLPASYDQQLYSQHVTDMCDHGAIETSAHLIFQDGVQRYFISNELNYWFLNLTEEKPDVESALKIPYEFRPDVAILKDTQNCQSGYLSLLLIQMRHIDDTNEAEWLTLEMKIGNWYDNKTGPIFWNQVNKIAHCDLEAQVCTTTDNYFATMSFDFKKKLDSAFGTIGKTAYFIQDQQMFKVFYKSECISNPYMQVISYPAVDIGTQTSAALSVNQDNLLNLILFDNDVHIQLNMSNDYAFEVAQIQQATWQENAHYFFKQCPLLDSTFAFLFVDLFSGSKRHHFTKKIILISSVSILICLILLIMSIIMISYLKANKNKNRKFERNGSEPKEEQLIEQSTDIKVKSIETQNGEKTFLQTSC